MRYRVTRTTNPPYVTDATLADERRILGAVDAEIVSVRCDTPAELAAQVGDSDALFAGHIPTTAAVIAAMPRCKGIVTASIGFDMIDLRAATARGIPVANVPDFCVREVANHTMGLLIACSRKIVPLHSALVRGVWSPTMFPPMAAIHGETLGLISFGRIARQVAIRARAFEMRVLAYDPFVDAATAADFGVELMPLDDMLRFSDYISVHAPLNDATRHLLSDRAFGLMKPTATVINTSRGAVIDEAALIRALQSGRIGAAGLDVFEREPVAPDDPLLAMENVVLTPHSAGFSDEAIRTVRRLGAEEIARMLRGERPRNLVNPEILDRMQS